VIRFASFVVRVNDDFLLAVAEFLVIREGGRSKDVFNVIGDVFACVIQHIGRGGDDFVF